jgi:hypothetical protein
VLPAVKNLNRKVAMSLANFTVFRQAKYLLFIIIILSGCKSISYLNTPNDVLRKKGVVYLLDETKKEGEITIQFETGHGAPDFIRLKNGDNDEKIRMEHIKLYRINEDYYYPKIIELDFMGTKKLLFVKSLTKQDSRIQLYELYQQRKQTPDGTDQFYYFISLPGQTRLEAWYIGSNNLMPNFDEKMSKIVNDCPMLSDKIKLKTKGYFLGPLTLSDQKKVEIFQRIINEYNDCH